MRYTTVIDISEYPTLYGNVHCRILYFHMALKAGYHDEDRDIYRGSIRTLAVQSGLTVSATRHALAVLSRANLLTKVDNGWRVTKWVLTPSITARPKNRTEAAERKAAESFIERHERKAQEAQEQRRQDEKREEMNRRKWLEETDFLEFVAQYEAVQEKVNKHQGNVSDTIWLGMNARKYEFAKEQANKISKPKTK